jgi:APA family basic amino acid/polyamine antiporter
VIVCIVVGLVGGLVDSTFLWDMVSMGTLTAFIVVSIAVPVIRHKQGDATTGFRVPFGPYLIPALSVCACLYIMKDLPPATFRVFAIWMAVAVLTYFIYGLRNSRLNKAL